MTDPALAAARAAAERAIYDRLTAAPELERLYHQRRRDGRP
jgi:hypothetical protein